MDQLHISHWIAFGLLIFVLLALDLLVFHRKVHEPTLKESAGWTVFWVSLGLLFNLFVWWWRGDDVALKFLTAFIVEKSLSIDNIFVFAVIFRYFRVPGMYQYRVLFWGVLGAIVLRLVFIVAGTEMIHRFEWVLPVFGAFLLYTGFQLVLHKDSEVEPQKNFVLRMARRVLRISHQDHHEYGQRFFVREAGQLCVTPLFLVLLVVESTDVMFAVDSVPAVLGIARDPFIVFTSNIFAILGLRALYFLLAGVIELFRYLHFGLAAVLAFVGMKMMAEYFLQAHMASWVSLLVVVGLLAISILASLLNPARPEELIPPVPERIAAEDEA